MKFEVSSRKSADKFNQSKSDFREREREDLVKRRKKFNRNERFFFVNKELKIYLVFVWVFDGSSVLNLSRQREFLFGSKPS